MVPARRAAPAVVRLAVRAGLVALLLLAVPAAALAADPVTISRRVLREGAPVANVGIVVSVIGGDEIAAATTDEQGTFSVEVEAEAGSSVRIDATGQTSRSEPDAHACVRLETPTGSLTFTLDELPPAAVVVPMDDVLTGTVCGPTPTPGITPPSTDGPARAATGDTGGGLLLVLGALSLVAAGT